MTSGIYKIKNDKNGRCYYGSTKDIECRFERHKRDLRNNSHHNIFLQRDWNKTEEELFLFEILEEVDEESLLEKEQEYIDKNEGGYNLAPAMGGDIISTHPDREKIREKIRNSNRKRLDERSEEEKVRLSIATSGENNPNWKNGGTSWKWCPICNSTKIKSIANVCIGCVDRNGVNNNFYGKTHTKETKEKLREVNLGREKTKDEIKKITGENSVWFKGYYHTPWGTFPSSSQASKANPILSSYTIWRWCNSPDNVIKRKGNSKFLQQFDDSIIGKTYEELGFWFEAS